MQGCAITMRWGSIRVASAVAITMAFAACFQSQRADPSCGGIDQPECTEPVPPPDDGARPCVPGERSSVVCTQQRACTMAGGVAVAECPDSGRWPEVVECECEGARCNDGRLDPGEQCDGSALRGATCRSVGAGPGALRCTPACTLDTSGCSFGGVSGAAGVPQPAGSGGGAGIAGGSGIGGFGGGEAVAECIDGGHAASPDRFGALSGDCQACVCEACGDVSTCDDACWALFRCLHAECTPPATVDLITCITERCAGILSGLGPMSFIEVGQCAFPTPTSECGSTCYGQTGAGTP